VQYKVITVLMCVLYIQALTLSLVLHHVPSVHIYDIDDVILALINDVTMALGFDVIIWPLNGIAVVLTS